MAINNVPQTVTDLVDCFLLLSVQLAITHSVLFEEISNLVAGCQEVVITNMVIVSSGKLCLREVNFLSRRRRYQDILVLPEGGPRC